MCLEFKETNGEKLLAESSKDLIEHLRDIFPWSGNVRELEGLVSSIVSYSAPGRAADDYLSLKDIPDFHWRKQQFYGPRPESAT